MPAFQQHDLSDPDYLLRVPPHSADSVMSAMATRASFEEKIQKCIVQSAKDLQRKGDENDHPCPVDWLLVFVRHARISRYRPANSAG
jgi:hypothetical protein